MAREFIEISDTMNKFYIVNTAQIVRIEPNEAETAWLVKLSGGDQFLIEHSTFERVKGELLGRD